MHNATNTLFHAGCHRLLIAGAICVALTAGRLPAQGRQSPFDTTPPAKTPPPSPPGSGQPTADSATASTNPAVLTLRETKPTTPSELMEAVQIMVGMRETAEAKTYLRQLLASQPTAEAILKLQRNFGTALFLRLARDEKYAPEGIALGRLMMAARGATVEDPRRATAVVAQLNDASPARRAAARAEIRRLGAASVPALVANLADPARTAQHAKVRSTLVGLGRPAVPPLVGTLAGDEPSRLVALDALGRIGELRSLPHVVGYAMSSPPESKTYQAAAQALVRLVGEMPSSKEMDKFLRHRVEALLAGALPGRRDEDDMLIMWRFDPQNKRSQPGRYAAEEASFIEAADLARHLYLADTKNATSGRLFLTSVLQLEKLLRGTARPLSRQGGGRTLGTEMGMAAVHDVFLFALKKKLIPAAIGAAEILGDIGDESLLASKDGRPRPLVAAVRHRDRQLRFAAVDAVLRIDPHHAFPGSSYVPHTLGFLASSSGLRRALVVHPKFAVARNLAGMLVEAGFEADIATGGREALRAASRESDYELILLSSGLDQPSTRKTLQLLRRDMRTAKLPLGIMVARNEELEEIQRLLERDPRSHAFPQPLNTAGMSISVGRLAGLVRLSATPPGDRMRQAQRALAWMARLAERPRKYAFYDILQQQRVAERALNVPQLAKIAMRVLALLATPGAQRALVDTASQNTRTMGVRKDAAAAFAAAVKRRGILLTGRQIQGQYDRYNQSATMDKETQQLLGGILDVLEQPTRPPAKPAPPKPVPTKPAAKAAAR